MPNFIEIGGVTRKPLVDLTRNDPCVGNILLYECFFFEVRTITLFDVSLNVIAIHCNTELEMLYHVRNISQIICIPWVPVSQLSPWNPAMQMQLCPPSTSSHVPPFRHGLLTHWLTSVTYNLNITRQCIRNGDRSSI